LQHPDPVGSSKGEGTAAAALTDQNRDDRDTEGRHFEQVFSDRLTLPPFFSTDSAVGAGCIHKADNRPAEFLCLLHEAQGFAVTFRLRHTEIAISTLFCGMTFLNRDHRNRNFVQLCNSAYDSGVIRITAVTVKFNKSFENVLYIIKSCRPLTVAGQFHTFICTITGAFKNMFMSAFMNTIINTFIDTFISVFTSTFNSIFTHTIALPQSIFSSPAGYSRSAFSAAQPDISSD